MLYMLDTDIFTLYLRREPKVFAQILQHSSADLALSIISVEELWSGWWTALRQAKTSSQAGLAYERLTETIDELKNWRIVSFPESSILRYNALKQQKLNVRGNDLRIAATALETSAVVVTMNTRDFKRIAGLNLEDWSS